MNNVPGHVGIIPDGNRRWAVKNHLDYDTAYWYAMRKIADCLHVLYKQGVMAVSVYLLSKDNVRRSRSDLMSVIGAEIRFLLEVVPEFKKTFNVQVYHAGVADILPAHYLKALETVCATGNGYGEALPKLYLCAGYDASDDLVSVFQKKPDMTAGELIEHLSVPFALDMVIRTGGDMRISGFLPLQSKYAEYFFEPCYFPDISEERILDILEEFNNRQRRFGE